jgi:hypothetical protein
VITNGHGKENCEVLLNRSEKKNKLIADKEQMDVEGKQMEGG